MSGMQNYSDDVSILFFRSRKHFKQINQIKNKIQTGHKTNTWHDDNISSLELQLSKEWQRPVLLDWNSVTNRCLMIFQKISSSKASFVDPY